MHIADFAVGMLGANGIVCAGLPIATGAALAAQLEGGDKVAAVFFGDGSTNEGEFHECLNLSSIWKLPLIFACENNLYGANTPIGRVLPTQTIAERAKAYDIPAKIVDGNNVLAVRDAAAWAVSRARVGEGPSFLEFQTFRWHHHFEGGYFPDLRPPAEIQAWIERCPIRSFGQKLEADGILDPESQASVDREIKAAVEEAATYAVNSPFPDPEDALVGVYSE